MWMKKRHKVVFTVLKYQFKLFFKVKYNFKPIKYKLEKKPYLILSNHLGILDPFFVAASFSRPVYYIATADLFSTKYGKIINYLVAPIPKNKNVKELGPIKDCVKIVKEGSKKESTRRIIFSSFNRKNAATAAAIAANAAVAIGRALSILIFLLLS